MAEIVSAEQRSREYSRRALHNVYNYTLVGAVAAAGLLTGQWWLLAVGAGAEVLWALYGSSLPPIRRRVDRELEARAAEEGGRQRETLVRGLSAAVQERCRSLMRRQAEIARLASENATLGGELLASEVGKLQRLVDSFVGLAATAERYQAYLKRENVAEVERLARSYERDAAEGQGEAAELAKKNLELVKRRLERLREIQGLVNRAGGQLEVLENGFALLADQIVTLRSPAELSGQLDDLLDGVEAVRETARDADKLLQAGS